MARRERPVRRVDGTTVTLPDTSANQAAYPESRAQQPGLGFPLCRVLGLVCLDSGAVLNAAVGRFRGKGGDEQTLLRAVLDTLERGDVLVGDALFGTYFLLCSLFERGIDAVFEQHGARRRRTDFRCGYVQLWLAWGHHGSSSHGDDTLYGLFVLIAQQQVGQRPGSIEPRALKRRPKPYPLLTKPRAVARAYVIQHGHAKKLK